VRTAFQRTHLVSNSALASSTGSVESSRSFSGTLTTAVMTSVATYDPSASATQTRWSSSRLVTVVTTPSSSGPPNTMANQPFRIAPFMPRIAWT